MVAGAYRFFLAVAWCSGGTHWGLSCCTFYLHFFLRWESFHATSWAKTPDGLCLYAPSKHWNIVLNGVGSPPSVWTINSRSPSGALMMIEPVGFGVGLTERALRRCMLPKGLGGWFRPNPERYCYITWSGPKGSAFIESLHARIYFVDILYRKCRNTLLYR